MKIYAECPNCFDWCVRVRDDPYNIGPDKYGNDVIIGPPAPIPAVDNPPPPGILQRFPN